MDWKSTAVISGAGILATWFFSMPPTHAPAAVVTPAPRAVAARSATSRIDIEKEAQRLQALRFLLDIDSRRRAARCHRTRSRSDDSRWSMRRRHGEKPCRQDAGA